MPISFVNVNSTHGTSGSAAPTLPTGAQTGDLLVAILAMGGSSGSPSPASWPAGWTSGSVTSLSATTGNRMQSAYKPAVTGETLGTFTLPTNAGWCLHILCYRGCMATGVVATDWNGTPVISTSDQSSPITTGSSTNARADVWRIDAWSANVTATSSWGSYSGSDGVAPVERADAQSASTSGSICMATADSNGNITAANQTANATFTGTGSNFISWQGILIPASARPAIAVRNRAAIIRASFM